MQHCEKPVASEVRQIWIVIQNTFTYVSEMKQLPNHNSYSLKLHARPTIVLQSKFLRNSWVIIKLEVSRAERVQGSACQDL